MDWGGVTDPELLALLKRAVAKWHAMTPAEREAMCREQARNYALAEATWREDSTVEIRP